MNYHPRLFEVANISDNEVVCRGTAQECSSKLGIGYTFFMRMAREQAAGLFKRARHQIRELPRQELWYGVWKRGTEELLFVGTEAEVMEFTQFKKNSFRCCVSNSRRGAESGQFVIIELEEDREEIEYGRS